MLYGNPDTNTNHVKNKSQFENYIKILTKKAKRYVISERVCE